MPFDGTNHQPPPQPPRRETPASLLLGRAIGRLTEDRWGKQLIMGEICPIIALCEGAPGDPVSHFRACDALHGAAQRRGFDRVWRFNDHPSTTHAQVLALMEEARLDAQDAPAHADAGLYEATTGA